MLTPPRAAAIIQMCFKCDCPTCGKPSWKGCGMHIEQALRGVPVESRCPGWKSGRCQPATGGTAAPTPKPQA
eukprot:scaffold155215_cov39-Tisochrysis_lutea.AAC.1